MSQTIYKEHLSEPWFSLISLGLKTCEGRLHKHRFKTYKVGDIIMWFNDDFGKTRFVMTEITRTYVMETFKDFLTDNFHGGLRDALPGMPSVSHGLQVYRKYFTEEDEKKYGVISFELKVLKYKVIIERKDYLKKELLGYFSSVEKCIDACYEKLYDLIDEDKWNAYYIPLKQMIEQEGTEYLDRERNLLWDRKFNLLRSEGTPDVNCKMVDLTDAESINYYYHLLEHQFEVDADDLGRDTDDLFDKMIDEDELNREEIEECEKMERKRLNDIAWDILQHLPEELEKDYEDDTEENNKIPDYIPEYKIQALKGSAGRL